MNTTSAPELDPRDQIQFAADHRVGLEAGDYILEVEQSVSATDSGGQLTSHAFKPLPQTFSVLCEQFLLSPEQIHAVFPPPGSNGNYWRDLPHVILERSTLPWERSAKKDSNAPTADPPWLALLLFNQDAPKPSLVTTAGNLESKVSPYFPALDNEHGDSFTVIDVPASVLQTQLGASFSFDYQTHVRRRLAFLRSTEQDTTQPDPTTGKVDSIRDAFKLCSPTVALSDQAAIECYEGDNTDKEGNKWRIRDHPNRAEYEMWAPAVGGYDLYRGAHEKAVVMGNRLPMPGARNIVHLVSLEDLWDGSMFDWNNTKGVWTDKDCFRLVSLFQWEFFCIDPTSDLLSLMRGLNEAGTTAPGFHLPQLTGTAKSEDSAYYLNAGFVPLRHRFRQGSHSVSWYHGPLVPNEITGVVQDLPRWDVKPGVSLPASAADKLLIFDKTSGLFDASYAAAWELGRMLMLRSTKTATALAGWKHRYIKAVNARRHEADFGYELPIAGGSAGASGGDEQLPDEVDDFLNQLTLLHHVPFSYLVPDPNLLPPESLRFFIVDRDWIECLRDGAFSIGRVTATDKAPISATTLPILSGILVRSEIVSGFFDKLRVEGYTQVAEVDEQLISNIGGIDSSGGVVMDTGLPARYPSAKLVRLEQLSPHVMLCLFASPAGSTDPVKMVDIHLKQEMLHFGFDENGATLTDLATLQAQLKTKREQGSLPTVATDLANLEKKLRDANGNEGTIAITSTELKNGDTLIQALTPWIDSATRVVNITTLATAIATGLTSLTTSPSPVGQKQGPSLPVEPAIFALEMIAGTQLGRFCITEPL